MTNSVWLELQNINRCANYIFALPWQKLLLTVCNLGRCNSEKFRSLIYKGKTKYLVSMMLSALLKTVFIDIFCWIWVLLRNNITIKFLKNERQTIIWRRAYIKIFLSDKSLQWYVMINLSNTQYVFCTIDTSIFLSRYSFSD